MKYRIDELEDYDVELQKAAYISDGVFSEDDEDLWFECWVTENGQIYDTNFLQQFQRHYTLDERRTNDYCEEKGLLPFNNWDFNCELAIYWNGSNWVAEAVYIDGKPVEGKYQED